MRIQKMFSNNYIGTSKLGSGTFSSIGSLEGMVQVALEAAITLSGVVAVAYFMISGYSYIMSQGNDSEVKKAKEGLKWGAVGIGVVMGAVPIYKFIASDILGGSVII